MKRSRLLLRWALLRTLLQEVCEKWPELVSFVCLACNSLARQGHFNQGIKGLGKVGGEIVSKRVATFTDLSEVFIAAAALKRSAMAFAIRRAQELAAAPVGECVVQRARLHILLLGMVALLVADLLDLPVQF